MSQDEEQYSEIKSKSQLKREVEALQKLGEDLVKLKPGELDKIPLDQKLRDAILHAQQISSRSAIRRQRQYIGKLMREADAQIIQQAFDHLNEQGHQEIAQFHLIERLRDKLIDQGDAALDEVIEYFPHADRGQIRQLCRNARNERDKDSAPKSARKLFKYLRSLAEQDNAG